MYITFTTKIFTTDIKDIQNIVPYIWVFVFGFFKYFFARHKFSGSGPTRFTNNVGDTVRLFM